jgi:hypothetical protein
MLLSDLIADLEALDGNLPVLLASRPSDGHKSPSNEAHVKPFGEILVDESGNDVDIRPAQDGEGFSLAQVLGLSKGLSYAENYTVNGIDTEVLLPDGRVVRSSLPLLGVLGTDNSVLLLLGTPEQWPTVQYQ